MSLSGYKDGCLDPVRNTALISFCTADIHRWCILIAAAVILPESSGAGKSFDVFDNSTMSEENRGELTKSFPKWYELQSLSRLCIQVKKKPYLVFDISSRECDWKDSSVVAEATIKETEISRFNQLRIKNLAS